MELEVFKQLGLNDNEIKVYRALIDIGRSKTGPILKKASISSSSAYSSLSSLLDRGLVSFQVKNNIKYYQAESPNSLIEQSKAQTKELENISKEISILPIIHNERNEINVYEGAHGFKRAHEIMADEAKKGEEILAITYSKHFGKSKEVRRFFARLDHDLAVNKKCKMRLIVNDELKRIILADRKPFVSKYQFRCLPDEYFSPSGINISNSMLVIGVWGKNPIAFTIRNKAVIESFKSNFDFLWSKGRK